MKKLKEVLNIGFISASLLSGFSMNLSFGSDYNKLIGQAMDKFEQNGGYEAFCNDFFTIAKDRKSKALWNSIASRTIGINWAMCSILLEIGYDDSIIAVVKDNAKDFLNLKADKYIEDKFNEFLKSFEIILKNTLEKYNKGEDDYGFQENVLKGFRKIFKSHSGLAMFCADICVQDNEKLENVLEDVFGLLGEDYWKEVELGINEKKKSSDFDWSNVNAKLIQQLLNKFKQYSTYQLSLMDSLETKLRSLLGTIQDELTLLQCIHKIQIDFLLNFMTILKKENKNFVLKGENFSSSVSDFTNRFIELLKNDVEYLTDSLSNKRFDKFNQFVEPIISQTFENFLSDIKTGQAIKHQLAEEFNLGLDMTFKDFKNNITEMLKFMQKFKESNGFPKGNIPDDDSKPKGSSDKINEFISKVSGQSLQQSFFNEYAKSNINESILINIRESIEEGKDGITIQLDESQIENMNDIIQKIKNDLRLGQSIVVEFDVHNQFGNNGYNKANFIRTIAAQHGSDIIVKPAMEKFSKSEFNSLGFSSEKHWTVFGMIVSRNFHEKSTKKGIYDSLLLLGFDPDSFGLEKTINAKNDEIVNYKRKNISDIISENTLNSLQEDLKEVAKKSGLLDAVTSFSIKLNKTKEQNGVRLINDENDFSSCMKDANCQVLVRGDGKVIVVKDNVKVIHSSTDLQIDGSYYYDADNRVLVIGKDYPALVIVGVGKSQIQKKPAEKQSTRRTPRSHRFTPIKSKNIQTNKNSVNNAKKVRVEKNKNENSKNEKRAIPEFLKRNRKRAERLGYGI